MPNLRCKYHQGSGSRIAPRVLRSAFLVTAGESDRSVIRGDEEGIKRSDDGMAWIECHCQYSKGFEIGLFDETV